MNKNIFSVSLLIFNIATASENQQRPEDERTHDEYEADCAAAISSSSCGKPPISSNCRPDQHWSLAGLGYAHCVLKELNCARGSRLIVDQFDNPSCQLIVCESGRQLVENQCVIPSTELPQHLQVPAYDKQPYNYWGKGNRDSTNKNFSTAQIFLSYSTIDGHWKVSSTGIWSDYMTPSSHWLQNGPLNGVWTTNLTVAYSYLVTDIYGNYLAGPNGLSGPQPLPANAITPIWYCTGGAVNMPGGLINYMPVLIKVWMNAKPDNVVTARFNCEASGKFMKPFIIDARGYPEGTKNEEQLP